MLHPVECCISVDNV